MARPDLPIATMLLAQGTQMAPNGGLNILGVGANVATWIFPQALPPLVLVTLLSGGQPGKIYSTKYRAFGVDGSLSKENKGPDVPFTTQIKRANLCWNLHQISADPIMTKPGTYQFAFVIEGEELARVSLDVLKIPPPPTRTSPDAQQA